MKSKEPGKYPISGTRYTFIPVKDLNKNEQYSINITTKVKDIEEFILSRKRLCILELLRE